MRSASLGEVLEQELSAEESAAFTAVLKPLVESGHGRDRGAGVSLRGGPGNDRDSPLITVRSGTPRARPVADETRLRLLVRVSARPWGSDFRVVTCGRSDSTLSGPRSVTGALGPSDELPEHHDALQHTRRLIIASAVDHPSASGHGRARPDGARRRTNDLAFARPGLLGSSLVDGRRDDRAYNRQNRPRRGDQPRSLRLRRRTKPQRRPLRCDSVAPCRCR